RLFNIPETGRRGYFEGHYSPLMSPAGEIIGGVCVVRDVTLQAEAAERVKETELRFQKMADTSPVLLWMAGTDSLCNFFNHTWLNFTGRSLEQSLGVGWAEDVHAEDFQRCMDTYEGAFANREEFEMEYR